MSATSADVRPRPWRASADLGTALLLNRYGLAVRPGVFVVSMLLTATGVGLLACGAIVAVGPVTVREMRRVPGSFGGQAGLTDATHALLLFVLPALFRAGTDIVALIGPGINAPSAHLRRAWRGLGLSTAQVYVAQVMPLQVLWWILCWAPLVTAALLPTVAPAERRLLFTLFAACVVIAALRCAVELKRLARPPRNFSSRGVTKIVAAVAAVSVGIAAGWLLVPVVSIVTAWRPGGDVDRVQQAAPWVVSIAMVGAHPVPVNVMIVLAVALWGMLGTMIVRSGVRRELPAVAETSRTHGRTRPHALQRWLLPIALGGGLVRRWTGHQGLVLLAVVGVVLVVGPQVEMTDTAARIVALVSLTAFVAATAEGAVPVLLMSALRRYRHHWEAGTPTGALFLREVSAVLMLAGPAGLLLLVVHAVLPGPGPMVGLLSMVLVVAAAVMADALSVTEQRTTDGGAHLLVFGALHAVPSVLGWSLLWAAPWAGAAATVVLIGVSAWMWDQRIRVRASRSRTSGRATGTTGPS